MDRAVFDAFRSNSFDSAKALIQQVPSFVNFQRQEADAVSLLMAASRQNNSDLIRWLLQKGADPFLKDHKGKTALDWAITSHHSEAASILLQQNQGHSHQYQSTSPGNALRETKKTQTRVRITTPRDHSIRVPG